MIIKDKFSLLRGVDNTLSLSSSTLKKVSVEDGPQDMFHMLRLIERRINHFTKRRIFGLISSPIDRKIIKVVNLPSYLLPVSYNSPTKEMIINLSTFGISSIEPTKPGPYNLYACLVYGICFRDLVTGRSGVNERYSSIFASYLTSVFIRLFGKDYGLIGTFATEIPKLKFLINCYVLGSFFGMSGERLFRRAEGASGFNFRKVLDELKKYDFSEIGDFISSLSDLRVMPGVSKHSFTSKIIQRLTVNFLPGLEDLPRFIAIMTTSNILGSNIVPTNIYRYNEDEFNNILEISKVIFKRG